MYLVLHSTYTTVEVALCSQGSLIDATCIDKYEASGQLLVALAALCARQNITSDQIEFIVAQAGPGPFSTLRAVLATANGLATALGIKIVAVDGLRALLDEYRDDAYPVTMALLNAYSNDIYYALDNHGQITTGIIYGVDSFKQTLQQLDPHTTIRFIGNGVPLHEPLIREICGPRVYIPTPNPETCSATIVARIGYQKWVAQEDITDQVAPLYLKNYTS